MESVVSHHPLMIEQKGPCPNHAKRIYSGEMLEAGGQRSWYWACPDCLTTGTDTFGLDFTPAISPAKYWRVMRDINPKCWVPQAFR